MTLLSLSVAALVSLYGCTGPAETPKADTDKGAQTTATETPATSDAPPKLSADDLAKESENIALVPSVVETESALEAAGISTKLQDLMVERKYDMNNPNKDNVAVRTGVVIADMLLTVKTAPKEKLVDEIEKIKAGMTALDGGNDIQVTLNDMEDRIKGDSVTRDELLKELDELSGAVIPELTFNGQERIVPLIQAGSWLEGANLVAKAVKQSSNASAADALLKQPAVVDYFIKYVKTEGAEKAPAAITDKLEESLTTLDGVAKKQDKLTAEDIDTVIKTTDDVLALL